MTPRLTAAALSRAPLTLRSPAATALRAPFRSLVQVAYRRLGRPTSCCASQSLSVA